jgi:two-component system, cell cycle sensor histidine kinase and response regulator CckA
MCAEGSTGQESRECARLQQEVLDLRAALAEAEGRLDRAASEAGGRDVDPYFEHALDLLCIADTDGHFRRLNPAWQTALGYPLAEMEGRSFFAFVHPEDVEATRAALADLQAQREVRGFCNRFRARDGSYRWLEWRTFPAGKVLYAVARDVTEHRRASAALDESRRMLQLILDTIPVRVFWKDVDGRYLGCNRPFAEDAGVASTDDVIGRDDYAMAWAEQAEQYRRDDARVVASGQPKLHYEEPQTGPGGRQLWLRTSKIPLRDAEGRPIGILGTYEDVTDRKRAELALRESLRRLRAVVEGAPIVLYSLDRDGVLTLSEGKGLASLGFAPGEAVGRSARELYRDAPDVLRDLERCLAGESFSSVGRIGDRVYEGSHRPLLAEDGSYQGTIGVLLDVTDRHRAEEQQARLETQLQHSQRLESIGRLAGGVAHDFNNALMVILGFCEIIRRKRAADEALVADLLQIERAGMRASDITRQLLAFSRRQVISPRPLDLSGFLVDMRRTLGRLIGEDVDLRFHLAEDVWSVRIDPAQVDQVMMNLAANARDAMPRGGKLTIETANVHVDEGYCRLHAGFHVGDYVLLAVSDNGEGMDSETLPHIFEPFFTTKATGKGTGLGLATVYGIVTQNGGVLNVYSEPGHGTTFKIYLPRLRDASVPARAAVAEVGATGGGRVLLVEDDESVARVTAAMLEALGFVVLRADGWRSALALAGREEARIDLLLTDVVMPEMSGREVAERACALRPDLKVLYTSGYTANVIAHHGILDEGVRFIQKPFSIHDLARSIREVLGNG